MGLQEYGWSFQRIAAHVGLDASTLATLVTFLVSKNLFYVVKVKALLGP